MFIGPTKHERAKRGPQCITMKNVSQLATSVTGIIRRQLTTNLDQKQKHQNLYFLWNKKHIDHQAAKYMGRLAFFHRQGAPP